MIVHLLQSLGGTHSLRPVALAARGPFSEAAKCVSFSFCKCYSYFNEDQRELCNAFSEGSYNVIVGTKYAEDVDLPGASTVIQWVTMV